jgi:hypothetical protein
VLGPLSHTQNTVTVLLRNQDDSGYLAPLHQPVLLPYGPAPKWRMILAAGDVDGDGDPELVGNRVANDTLFDGPAAGQRLQIGTGVPGQGDIVPLLGAVGPFRVGETVNLSLCGMPPGATGWITFYDTTNSLPAPFSGTAGRLQTGPFAARMPFVASGVSGDPIASGTWTHSFVVKPQMAGAAWHYVALVNDPDAVGGKSRSNLLVLTYGN